MKGEGVFSSFQAEALQPEGWSLLILFPNRSVDTWFKSLQRILYFIYEELEVFPPQGKAIGMDEEMSKGKIVRKGVVCFQIQPRNTP